MSRTVLVVDDEPALRMVMRTRLQLSGYRVLEAETGEKALSVLASETPDAVLLDVRMPGIDGWQVLERLRALSSLESLRVIMVSAHCGAAVAKQAREFGCRAVLAKPFTLRELISTLEGVLDAP